MRNQKIATNNYYNPQNVAKSQELFELNYDGQLVYEGEQLYDQGAVEQITKPEKNLWVAMVSDDIFYEVELYHPFTQKRKHSCECSEFKSKKSCKHITAALFALREKLKKEAELKARKAKERASTPKKLNINTLLQELDKDELVQFVKAYSRKDRNFNIALKAHFARRVDLEDNKAKYKSILDSIIKPVTSAAGKARASELKNYIHVSKELLSQLEDALSLNEYTDAYYIIDAGISKAEYVRHHYTNYGDETAQISSKYHQLLVLLYQRVHADALKQKLKELMLELPQRSYYQHDSLQEHLYYRLLKRLPKGNVLIQELLDHIKELMGNKRISDDVLKTLIALRIMAEYGLDELDDIDWLIKGHSRLSMSVVDRLVDAKESEISIALMQKMKEHFPKSRELKRKLIQVHLVLGQTKEMAKLLPEYVEQSDDLPLMFKLQDHLTDSQWSGVVKKLQKHYDKHKSVKLKEYVMLLNHEHLYDELIAELMEQPDISLVTKYDHSFYRSHHKQLVELYQVTIANILDNYLGDKAQLSVRRALNHIERLEARKLYREVVGFIEKEYKHRQKYLL